MAQTRKRHPNGDTYCSACKTLRLLAFKKAEPERMARYRTTSNRRKRYGLEPVAFAELLLHQNGCCAVCQSDQWGKRGPHVDHDHVTGEIRGLLCHRCNTAIGLLQEDVAVINSVLKYLAVRQAGKAKPRKQKGK